jgi:hypothetical protein
MSDPQRTKAATAILPELVRLSRVIRAEPELGLLYPKA